MGICLGNKIKLAAIAALFFNTCHGQNVGLPIYTQGNTIWKNDSDKAYFIILKGNKYCLQCFAELDEYLHDSLHTDNIYSLSLVDSSVFDRKKEAIEVKKLFRYLKAPLFEYDSSEGVSNVDAENKNTLFYKYKAEYTPALIYVYKNKISYLSYSDLFTKDGIKPMLGTKIPK